jgi:hypothetical protein
MHTREHAAIAVLVVAAVPLLLSQQVHAAAAQLLALDDPLSLAAHQSLQAMVTRLVAATASGDGAAPAIPLELVTPLCVAAKVSSNLGQLALASD